MLPASGSRFPQRALLEVAVDDAVEEWEAQPTWLKTMDQAAHYASQNFLWDELQQAAPWVDLGSNLLSSGSALVGAATIGLEEWNAALAVEQELAQELEAAVAEIQSGGGVA